MDTLDKISNLLKEQKKTQKELCDYLGIKNNAFTGWKSGHTTSYRKYLPQIADFLGVSVDYLLGKTEIRKRTALSEQPLSPNMEECINLLMILSESELEITKRFMSSLHDSNIQESVDNE